MKRSEMRKGEKNEVPFVGIGDSAHPKKHKGNSFATDKKQLFDWVSIVTLANLRATLKVLQVQDEGKGQIVATTKKTDHAVVFDTFSPLSAA